MSEKYLSPTDYLLTNVNGQVLTITLNRPDALNSISCLLYTSPSPRDATLSRMPSSA